LPQLPQLALLVCRLTHCPLQLVVPLGQLHERLTHEAPPAQATPHPPQFFESIARSTQPPLHAVSPAPQPFPHTPALQTRFVPQALPQEPQFARSELVLTHVPLQMVWPVGHVHIALMHVAPVAHTVPHAPQFLASVCVDVQEPLQFVWPAPQVETHVPFEQAWPAEQAWPHWPQFLGSAASLLQTPAHSVSPTGHTQVAPVQDAPVAQA
jgi:hypothetical protein